MSEERRAENERRYWILTRSGEADASALILSGASGDIFPVFSFREEAELFLWLSDLAGGWSVGSVCARQLAALFLTDYSDVEDVALDPLPEAQARSLIDLVTVSRSRFVGVLQGRDLV